MCGVGMMFCEPDRLQHKAGVAATVVAGVAIARVTSRLRCAAGGALVAASMAAFPAGLIARDLWRQRRSAVRE